MNILYCGDKNIEDGLLISILSLLKNVNDNLHIYVMTMNMKIKDKEYFAVTDKAIEYLDGLVKEKNHDSFVIKLDVTDKFINELPKANMETRFTPFCMLRLYADMFMELPDKILYLDNDVICRKDISDLYNENIEKYELAGVLDYYGKWFFKKKFYKFDYLNSGVLLLNLKMIRQTGLFRKCRKVCATRNMFMPDQSAINKLSRAKKKLPGIYNEQRRLHKNTVIQHFTTSFRLFPWIHTLTVKPWQVDRVHEKLKMHEYDDILDEYTRLVPFMKAES